ncbi:MAG: DUF3025 domain-containing protein [Casimicrobiaceae bacterium]
MQAMPAPLAHPAFAPYRRWLSTGTLPDLAQLNAWAVASRLSLPDGRQLRFADAAPGGALAYEVAVAHDGVVQIRPGDWHDAFNALVWLAFPLTKAALNARHVHEGASATPNARSRGRDAATLLDESGLLLACRDPGLLRLLRERAWRELFDAHHDAVARAMRPFAIGHGMLVKMRAPFRAITARTLILPLDPEASSTRVDEAAALAIGAGELRPEMLSPLPVAALPGWDREGLGPRLFDDEAVFRR